VVEGSFCLDRVRVLAESTVRKPVSAKGPCGKGALQTHARLINQRVNFFSDFTLTVVAQSEWCRLRFEAGRCAGPAQTGYGPAWFRRPAPLNFQGRNVVKNRSLLTVLCGAGWNGALGSITSRGWEG